MRISGALIIIAGRIATAVLVLLPVGGSVFGTTYDCGMPIVSALDRGGRDFTSNGPRRSLPTGLSEVPGPQAV